MRTPEGPRLALSALLAVQVLLCAAAPITPVGTVPWTNGGSARSAWSSPASLPAHPEGLSLEEGSGARSVLGPRVSSSISNATGNLTASLGRVVFLVGLAASAVVTLVWSRVALSWFSHDPSRKVQAKERARDALIGSMVLLAAVTGLAWGLAHWVLTGS